MKIIAAGIICCNNKILIAQRKRGKAQEFFWEFPGGKQEQGETLPECLKREIQEELNIDIVVDDFFMKTQYNYDTGSIEMHAFFAHCTDSNLSFHPEHETAIWIEPQEMQNYTFAPADIPIVKALVAMPR